MTMMRQGMVRRRGLAARDRQIAGMIALVLLDVSVPAFPKEREKPPATIDPAAKMPPLIPAEFDESLAIGGEEIDARKLESRMTVEVRVNGTGPHRFVVDSGADTSVVGRRLAAALAMPAAEPVLLNSMTSSGIVERVRLDRLELGPTVIEGLDVPVLAEADLGAAGMIGLDSLVEQRLMLDFEKRLITIDDGRTPPPRFDGEIVVIARLHRGQLILTQVKANDKPVEAVIDTGSEITIGNEALRRLLLGDGKRARTSTVITGVTGADMSVDIVKVARLKLGPVTLQNVAIAFADVPPFAVFGLSDEPALLLGTDLMENFRKVSLDFHNRKVRFQLDRCAKHTVRVRTMPGYASRLSADTKSACR